MSAPSGSQSHSRRHATTMRPKCALLAPEPTGAIIGRRRQLECLRRGRRRRQRRSSTSSAAFVVSASASASNEGDDDAYSPTKDESNNAELPEPSSPSISFQRTRGEVAGGGAEEAAADGDPFRPGDVVDGRYRVESVLGRGALGVTFAVRDERAVGGEAEGGELALKATRLRGRGAGGWKAFDLAEREAAALRSLSGHANIPRFERFFDVDRPDDRVRCLVEGRVRGGRPLSAVVAAGERASPVQVAMLARDVLSALAHLASRSHPVTHRDVKPENIVLEGGRWGEKAFLVDFSGVAAAALAASEGENSSSSLSSSSFPSPSAASLPGPGTTVIGTFGFMAPVRFCLFLFFKKHSGGGRREEQKGKKKTLRSLSSSLLSILNNNKTQYRNSSAAPRVRPPTSTPSAPPCSSP